MKRRHKKSAIAIVVIIASIYIGNLLIDNPYTHSLVNYYLNHHLLSKLPIRAEYQSMKLQLVPPAVTIYGVKVASPKKDGGSDELLSLSTMTFTVSPWSIFMGSSQLGNLELKDLKVAWPLPDEFMAALRAQQTSNNLQDQPASWPPSFPLPLSSLRITNATVTAQLDGISLNTNQDPKEITRITSEGFNLSADFVDWKSFRVDINSNQTSITDRSSSYIENGRINLRGEMRGKNFIGKKIEISSPRINFFGKSNLEIKTRKNTEIIESLSATITGENIEGDMSILGSFLDIPGNLGDFQATSKTLLTIPLSTKVPLSFSTTGRLKSSDARFFGFRLFETESDFEIDLNKFKLENTLLKIGDTIVAKGGGQIDFNRAVSYNFNLQPINFPFRNMMDLFNVDITAVDFDLTSPSLKIVGTSAPFKMDVTTDATLSNFTIPLANYERIRHPISPTCQMTLGMDVNSSALFFKNTNGTCFTTDASGPINRFPLSISGFSTFSSDTGMDVTISSPQLNLAAMTYFSQTRLSGRGPLETRIFGPYDGIKVRTSADIKEASIEATPFANIKLTTEVFDGQMTWSDVSATTRQGGLIESPKGSLKFNDDLDVDFTLNAKMVDAATLSNLVRDASDGQTQFEMLIKNLSARLRGPAAKPLTWKGEAFVEAENVKLGSGTLARTIKGTIKGSPSGYISEDLFLDTAGSHVEIKFNHVWDPRSQDRDFLGGLGLHRTDQVDISAVLKRSPGRGQDLQSLPFVGKQLEDLGISTEASGDIKLAGTFASLTGLAKLQFSNTNILNSKVSDIVCSMVIDGSRLDIMAEQGGSALQARISLDLGKPEIPYNWYIAAKNADFRPWLPSLMSQDARNFAYLSATWNMQGNLVKWWDSVGELELRDLRVRYYSLVSRSGQRVDFRNAHASKILFEKSGWRMTDNRPLVVKSTLGELSLGLHNFRPPQALGLTTKGHIDIEALRLVFPDVEVATGSLRIDGGIFGSIENPNVDIKLRDASDRDSNKPTAIGFNGFRPSFQNIKLAAHVRTDGITIETLRADKGNGDLQVSGFLARPGSGEETDLTINMNSASFLYPFPIIKYFDSTIGGQIKITGSGRPWTASGSIDIVKARSNRDVDIREAILESIRSQSAADSTSSIIPLINMDISITADKSIGFSSRAGQATLSSDLRVSGSNITPSIIGLVDVSKGRFFYKREFEIKRGLINFDDPIKVDPALDISATSDVSSYRVAINISGRASSPVIDFSVDPPTRPDGTPLSKIDIIGLLSRGSLPDSTQGIGSAESTAASEALNIAAGQVEDTVQKIFDLSGQSVIRQVYIDTYADSEGMPIVRFNLPLNITEDFDVVLKVDQSTVKVSSEYSLHDSISLTGGIESSNDQTGINSKTSGTPADTGVDLKFKFAFP